MIYQNNSDFNCDGSNTDEKGTNSKTSPRTTSRDKVIQLLIKHSDYLEINPDKLKQSEAYRIGYLQGADQALRALDRESNPYLRSQRYNEQQDGLYEHRSDWLRVTGDLGRDAKNLKKLKRFLREYCKMIFKDTHRTSKGYNHVSEDANTGALLSWSLETDTEGSGNNKGKYTLSIPGKYFQTCSTYSHYVLIAVLKRDYKVRVKRIDLRLRDYSKFLIPNQLRDYCNKHLELHNRPPIKGIKKNKKGVWNYAYHEQGGADNATFVIGSHPRRLTIYDERHNHKVDAIAWELRVEDDIADKYAEDLVSHYELALFHCRNQANEECRKIKDVIEAETTQRMYDCNIDSSQYREIYGEVYAEHKQKIYEYCVEIYMFGVVVTMITSAFTFYETIKEGEEHITERCEVAQWWLDFKEKLQVDGHIRHASTKTYTTLDKARQWRDGNWNNTTILLGAAAAGIGTRVMKSIEDKLTLTRIIVENIVQEYTPVVMAHIDKFYRSRHAKLLDSYIAVAA